MSNGDTRSWSWQSLRSLRCSACRTHARSLQLPSLRTLVWRVRRSGSTSTDANVRCPHIKARRRSIYRASRESPTARPRRIQSRGSESFNRRSQGTRRWAAALTHNVALAHACFSGSLEARRNRPQESSIVIGAADSNSSRYSSVATTCGSPAPDSRSVQAMLSNVRNEPSHFALKSNEIRKVRAQQLTCEARFGASPRYRNEHG